MQRAFVDPDARQRGVDPNVKNAGNAQWLQLLQLHRISGRSYREATKPSYNLLTNGCADVEAPVAGPYPADACRPPSAVLALGQRAGPPYQPDSLLMDTPFPLDELVLRAAEDGHETPDSSPHYRKAPIKGYNSKSSSSSAGYCLSGLGELCWLANFVVLKRLILSLKLTFRQYPAIHTNYIISHCTTLQYRPNHNYLPRFLGRNDILNTKNDDFNSVAIFP